MLDVSELRARTESGERFEYLFFWGHRSEGRVTSTCLSQWYPAGFVVDGVRYATAEHWMMAGKARLFGDAEHLSKILEAPDPGAAKKLGRRVRGFEEARWREARVGLVTEGSVHKFGQNEALGRFLADTGERVLVEASPLDRVWGIGLSVKNPAHLDPAQWRGENLLGFALMEARETLRAR